MHLAFLSPAFGSVVDTDHPAAEPVAALAKALLAQGHAVRAVLPMLEGVDPLALGLARRLRPVEVRIGDREERLVVYEGRTPGGIDLTVLDHEEMLREAPTLSSGDPPTRALRTALFAEAALQWVQQAEQTFDVVHVHGTLGAVVARIASERDLAWLWTLYGVGEHRFGPPLATSGPEVTEAELVAEALRHVPRLVVPSRAFLTALRRGRMGTALATALDEQGPAVMAIEGGLDEATWNPSTDPLLEFHFDPVDLRGKWRGRAALQRRVGLEARDDVPLLHADVTDDAVAERLAATLSTAMHNELQVVLTLAADLATPGREALERLAGRFEERVRLLSNRDARTLHRCLAAADLCLLAQPWAAEPSAALAALRYGALPLAARGTAFEDVLVDCDAALRTGTGFLYDPEEPGEPGPAIQRATAAWHRRDAFEQLQRRVMRRDVSWSRAASRYLRVYDQLAAARDGGDAGADGPRPALETSPA